MKALISVLCLSLFSLAPHIASAQEGCVQSKLSCSQMNVNCEKQCQNARNASACIARACMTALTACQANGIWRSTQNKAACWKAAGRS